MAKPKKSLKKLLTLLHKKPMTKHEIRTALKVHRKTEYVNVKEALKQRWIEEDELKRYHLTLLGKLIIDTWKKKPTDSTLFEVYPLVTNPITSSLESNRLTAKCTLIIKDAGKIKELDDKTASYEQFISDLPENATNIKSALAHVIDSILDLKANYMGLHTVLDSQLAENLSMFNIETNFPDYDSVKRKIDLAKTNFKVLIEFDGEKWVKTQKLDDLEKQREDNLKFYKEAFQRIRLQERRIRIYNAIQLLDSNLTKDRLGDLLLFATKAELKEFVYKIFQLDEKDNNKLKELVTKAFATGLLECDRKVLYHLKMNKEKIQEFYNSINI
jgi:hypothetical protein